MLNTSICWHSTVNTSVMSRVALLVQYSAEHAPVARSSEAVVQCRVSQEDRSLV